MVSLNSMKQHKIMITEYQILRIGKVKQQVLNLSLNIKISTQNHKMKDRIHQIRTINAKYLLLIYNKFMARTKQTARKALVGVKAPKKRLIKAIKKGAGKRGGRGLNQQSSSQSEIEDNINTQQFSIRFDDQQKCQKQCVQGKLFYCKDCNAILTIQSKLITKEKYDEMKSNPSLSDAQKQKFLTQATGQVWICQFCLTHNSVQKKYSPPKQQNPCCLLQKVALKKSKSNTAQEDEKRLIFCIDISGSMDFVGVGSKSRLQAVKEAISDQISRMNFQKQKYRVGLITFGSYVNLIGDGKVFKQKVLETALYHSFQNITKQVGKIDNFCQPITKSFSVLKNKVKHLATYGSTALGPGLLSAIELASKGPMGSRVIICTDGEANVGIGGSFNVDRFTFYNEAAEYAKKKKVMVSILSLKGDRCNLKQLGKLSLATRGSVMKIDPAALGTQFSKITQQQILGSQSKLTIKLNKIFQFVNYHIQKPQDISKDLTSLTQDYGNFTAQTQLTFQFAVLDKQEAAKNPAIDLDLYKQQKVPMQIQLQYTGRDGSKYLQVITDWRQLTEDEKAIYQGANFGLFAASVLQRASRKIKNQQFKDAQAIVKGYWSIVGQKFSKTEPQHELNKFKVRVEKIQKVLNSKMKKAGLIKSQKPQKSKSKPKIAKKGAGKSKQVRGRGRSAKKEDVSSESHSRSRDRLRRRSRSISAMSSDSEEQVLYREMQARSRSISPKNHGKKGRK